MDLIVYGCNRADLTPTAYATINYASINQPAGTQSKSLAARSRTATRVLCVEPQPCVCTVGWLLLHSKMSELCLRTSNMACRVWILQYEACEVPKWPHLPQTTARTNKTRLDAGFQDSRALDSHWLPTPPV